MRVDRAGHIESAPQVISNAVDGEEESLFVEYHIPLEDSAEIDQRPRTLFKNIRDISKGGSDRSLDFSAIVEDSEEYADENPVANELNYSNSEDRFSPERNRKPQAHSHSQQDESLKAPRRRISDQAVKFLESAGDDDEHGRKIMKEEYRRKRSLSQNSPSRLGMDGHVVTNFENSRNTKSVYPASFGNINPTSPARNATVSTRASLSWDDSNYGADNDTKNIETFGMGKQDSFADGPSHGMKGYMDGDFSFNTSGSSPVDARLSASQNFSVASSDDNSRRRASSYGGSIAREPRIPEENRASGASFDESDASDAGATDLRSRIRDIFNFHTISVLIVKLIPFIFCLCCFKSSKESRGNSFTDRLILSRLNILSFFFSTIQLAASTWLIVVMFIEGMINTFGDGYEDQFNLWNNNAITVLIGGFALILLCTCFWTIRIVKEVDLVHALRLLWLLLWILPIVAFLNITAYDFYEVTSIWIKHNWDSTQLWWFRNQLCAPETDETLCLVPIEGGMEYESEDDWCFELYNSTECTEIRDEAQESTTLILLTFYRALASWGFAYMFVMLLIIKALERIISKPMVQKSRELNVVGWLTFPVLCTALFGSIILFSPYTYLDKFVQPRWIGYLYLITAGLFFIALLMGWFLSAFSIRSNVDKQNKSNAALILVFVLFVNAFVLLAIILASFLWSRNLSLTETQRGTIACTMNGSQCTSCDEIIPELVCPEWSFEEITRIVRRQLNQSAFMAAIFILYDLNVMVHGFNLRKNLSMYQIDYV